MPLIADGNAFSSCSLDKIVKLWNLDGDPRSFWDRASDIINNPLLSDAEALEARGFDVQRADVPPSPTADQSLLTEEETTNLISFATGYADIWTLGLTGQVQRSIYGDEAEEMYQQNGAYERGALAGTATAEFVALKSMWDSRNAFRTPKNICFPAGTLVHTFSGLKPIETIRQGEVVWSYDHARHEWELRKVLSLTDIHKEDTFVTVTAGGSTVEATGGHPFWVIEGEDLADRPRRADMPPIRRIPALPVAGWMQSTCEQETFCFCGAASQPQSSVCAWRSNTKPSTISKSTNNTTTPSAPAACSCIMVMVWGRWLRVHQLLPAKSLSVI